MVLKELISPDKPGEALAGPICSSSPSLAPGWVFSLTVALHRCHQPWLGRLDRLQRGGRIQLPATFPTQLWCWGPQRWDHQVRGITGRGFLGSASALCGRCRMAVHRAPARAGKPPGYSRETQGVVGLVFGALFLPSLAFTHMEVLIG